MPDNVIPPSSEGTGRVGENLRLTSLAPLFDSDRHQLYYDLLLRAIDADGVRNIALTGAYGTGKSSVLEQLGNTHANRVIELSLSTIAPEVHDVTGPDKDVADQRSVTRTNLIQKEIVKQLLYRLPPGDVPRSRFRRASTPNRRRDWQLAIAIGTGAFAVLFGLGLLQPFVASLLAAVWRQVIAHLLLLGLAVCAAWAVISVIRSRPTMSASVQTGPATITLSKLADSYFDEYLDEIVYFFQASRRDIVVIEDIDRFEDAQVFDTLRALNGLLNGSEQIGHRIVFIYAIRDSVFEQIGARHEGIDGLPPGATSDRAKATLKRASRTKFFDVIIPVVPFVSADNARDVMTDAMTSDDFEIDPALIRLAARHVADMRMLHNIRNEFEVYRSRLVVPDERIPGISDDLVFAIVLFKNTHLADFEKIRHRDSSLDRLYSIWRALVQESLGEHTSRLATERRARRTEAATKARASDLGRRLLEFRDALRTAAEAAFPQATVELSGPADAENFEDPETWSRIASGEPQQLVLHDPRVRRYDPSTIQLSFTAQQLADLFGTAVDPAEWEAANVRQIDERIAEAEGDIRFLRHHTWADICGRPEFKVQATPFKLKDESGRLIEKSLSFSDVVDAALESDLARSLVRHGFLTSHFALYASSYYGNHLGPDAMEYIRRCVEPGIPDASFAMSETDVVQLLREQDAEKSDKAEFFNDASVFNVSILDYLLSRRPEAAETVARRLSRLGQSEKEFLDTYVSQGANPTAFLAAIAPHWAGVVTYTATTAPVDAADRPVLLDAVLWAIPTAEFDVDGGVKHAVESNYRNISAICQPGSTARAEIVLRLVRSSGAVLDSLEPLDGAARSVAVELRIFPINEVNLRVLVPTGVIALDKLRGDQAAYDYSLDQMQDYLSVVAGSPTDVTTVADPKMFATVLTDAAKRSDMTVLSELVDRSNPECGVANLRDVAVEAWPSLIERSRTDPTLENVSAYLQQFGMDTHLGALLNKHKKVTEPEGAASDQRIDVAVAVLAAKEVIPSTATRVRIAASLQPGTIDAAKVTPESGDLVARLIKRRLLADDAAAFTDRLMVDWATLEATIASSRKYATFVSPDVLNVADIPSLLRSRSIPQEAKLAVVSSISTHLAGAPSEQVRAVAGALVATGWGLPYATLEALRAGGATSPQIIALIAARADRLSTTDLKTLLQALGGDYARIASGGRGRPTFRADPAHEYLLSRLVGDTVKQVATETFKLKGRRLVAPLSRPRP